MGLRYAIFGSCVTRDAFDLAQRRGGSDAVVTYLARTTVNACLAAPVSLPAPAGLAAARFEERCVVADLAKTHFADLGAKPFDFLIVDLIDERHPVLSVDGSLVCRSVPLVRMAAACGLDLSGYEMLMPHDPRIVQATIDNIPKFVAELAAIAPPSRIVLHEALWASHYRAADGALRPFPDPPLSARCNDTLSGYYAAIRAACPQATSIRIDGDALAADERHRWGLEPFHYAEAYYDLFLQRLDRNACAIRRAAGNAGAEPALT
ncbi:MAG: DUF6270 domain-containing protein [Rhodospirillaceae bacterium]